MRDLQIIRLELDELEAMRLCDMEGRDQRDAGLAMDVSRGTIQRLVRSGRGKMIRALVESAALVINKGEGDEDQHSNL